MERKILLSHGGGGRMMRDLIEKVFREKFDNEFLNALDDAAFLPSGETPPVFTTDSYVVKPLFFPGGDIGKLSVCGTVNDLAVSGAEPAFISAGIIAEEGLDTAVLERIAVSMAGECEAAGVKAVCGDFKVVERGAADGLYINTAGIGYMRRGLSFSRSKIKAGDKILVNGFVGDHEASILLERGGFGLEGEIKSDCCSLRDIISALLDFHEKVLRGSGEEAVRFMRDATRGGAAAVLNEIAEGAGFGICVSPGGFPVREDVGAVCDMLGLDPLYLANEGKVIAVVNGKFADEALGVMRGRVPGEHAAAAGEVVAEHPGIVTVLTEAGGERILGMPEGGQLPRIC